jgi:hypothetical protein
MVSPQKPLASWALPVMGLLLVTNGMAGQLPAQSSATAASYAKSSGLVPEGKHARPKGVQCAQRTI